MTNQSDHATADDKTKTMAALGIGAVGVAGCVALVVIGVLVLLGLFVLVLLIYGAWLFLTNPYGVTF